MSDFIAQFLEALLDFARWLWGGLFPPRHKPWCAVLYFVSQEDWGLSYPEPALDGKLDEAVAAVCDAAGGRDNLHVVYRAVWNQNGRDPVAQVVRFLGQKTNYFEGCSATWMQPVDTGRDMSCFLDWVYRWCPADHYAVFFWGHSFGPAGLFEPGAIISLPQPGLPFLRRAFEEFNLKRTDGKTSRLELSAETDVSPGAEAGGAPPEEVVQGLGNIGAASDRIDVVLFQDCWMSTLETAYELRDVVRSLIASQSLVPILRNDPQFIWPYADLFDALTGGNEAPAMLATLKTFYDANFVRIPSLTTVPYALVDVTSIHNVKVAVQNLLAAIDLELPASNLADREALFLGGQIALYDGVGDLVAGDAALVDLRRLCAQLQNYGNAGIANAAVVLDALISLMVIDAFESLPGGGAAAGFGGLSALYRPSRENRGDTFITDALYDSNYRALGFPSDTGWPGIEQPR